MVNQRNTFVFVVCGDEKYISALNLAIRFLQTYSKSEIAVITDSRRNGAKIICDQVIDVVTPDELNHHQASVFLKTSLHRYLNLGNNRYCYLDSDVLALSEKVDEVFLEQPGIIGFCEDNMTLDQFSPYAVNCGCLEQAREDEQKLKEAQQSYDSLRSEWRAFILKQKGDVLEEIIRETAAKPVKNALSLGAFYFQKALPFYNSVAFRGYSYHKQLKEWKDAEGKVVLFPIQDYFHFVAEKTGFFYDKSRSYWCLDSRRDVCVPQCTHLHQQIKVDYGLSVTPDTWQHWNGGVFLFDRQSVDFLEYWHQQTMAIFNNSAWKTRDQGTLALTAWKFGLQQQACLNSRFNYIVDYFKPGLDFIPHRGFTRDNGQTYQQPEMIHVYHRFGDENWHFWQQVMATFKLKGVKTDE